jgi:hypothetical protein
MLLYSSYTAISLLWSRDPAMLQNDNRIETAICYTMLPLVLYHNNPPARLLHCYFWYSNSRYDPHTDTTTCYETIPLIIQNSIWYDTITTAIPPIRYLSDTNQYYRTTDTRYMLQKETIPPILTDNNIQRQSLYIWIKTYTLLSQLIPQIITYNQ